MGNRKHSFSVKTDVEFFNLNDDEIKDYILNRDDIYYNIIVIDDEKNKWKFDDIKDETNYEFTKLDEYVIGSGMVLAYYLIK